MPQCTAVLSGAQQEGVKSSIMQTGNIISPTTESKQTKSSHENGYADVGNLRLTESFSKDASFVLFQGPNGP